MDAATWAQWIGRLAACHRQLRRQLAQVAATEKLNDTEFLLLCCCRATAGELSQQHLAEHIGLSPSQASGVFDALRIKGCLDCQPAERDRRRQTWRITAAGEECVRRIGQRLQPLVERWQSCLSPNDQQSVLEVIQRLAACDGGSIAHIADTAQDSACKEAA